MPSDIDLSIAISSYNRDDKVSETLEYLFKSDVEGIDAIDLIVVDDGSPQPVRDVIKNIEAVPKPFELRLIEQENAGIGATRNRGFREAKSDLVLFLDDDILVKPDTIKQFLNAHRTQPGGVIFGSCPFRSHSSVSLRKFAVGLYGYDRITAEPCYEKVDAIASGLLCVDKNKLADREQFYRDDLAIPAAEEHEVIYRFHKLSIPIYHALHISATHNHHLELSWLVEQQYKYGLATAEAFAKVPELVEMEQYAELDEHLKFGGLKGSAKRLAGSAPGRALLLRLAHFAESLFPNGNNDRLFGLTATVHFWGGYTTGIDRYQNRTV